MRQNSSAATSAAAGSRRSGRAKSPQKNARTRAARIACGMAASSGRTSFTSGTSSRRLRKASAGASRLTVIARSGSASATSSAIRPPIELPTRWALSRPIASM